MRKQFKILLCSIALSSTGFTAALAQAQQPKPNILFIVSDDTGYGDLGPYGGGDGRGMPTPNIDKLADDGMTFFSFYAQPSCTPGRAAMQTGRIPNRSGMTTVAFQGQGGGLPAAEWTLASVLKQGGYQTYFTGKWHLGEADYALPNAQGYDEMKYVGLYHLNAYTYGDPTWFPDMDPKLRAMFQKVTKGALSGKAGEKPVEDFKINGQYVDTPRSTAARASSAFPSSTATSRRRRSSFLDEAAKSPDKPFYINVNFMKVHQPNMPAPGVRAQVDVEVEICRLDRRARHAHRPHHGQAPRDSASTRTRSSSTRPTTAPGRTSIRTPATRRSAAPRARCARAAIAFRPSPSGPARSSRGIKNHDIVGGLDLMATFASVAGVQLPDKDREGQPIIFDSYDMSPVLFGTGQSPRNAWFYFTENELSPGAARVGNYKAVFNLRGDDGQPTGGLAVDSNLGWKGAEKYVATVPQVFDLWQDPQERYDIFMNNYTERTWTMVTISDAIKKLMKTYVKYPPRKLQSASYTGPIDISKYEQFQWLREQLGKEGFDIPLPTGN